MIVSPAMSLLVDVDAHRASNLFSLRLEELADAARSRGSLPPGTPGPTSAEMLRLPLAVDVVSGVDLVIQSLVAHDPQRLADRAGEVLAATREHPDLASMAARRLRRLVNAPWLPAHDGATAAADAALRSVATLLADLEACSAPHPAGAASRHAGSAASSRHASTGTLGPNLSGRELQVARYVSLGMTNKQIAIQLRLSPNTIKRHLARILRRLGLGKRSAVATWYATREPGATAALGPAGQARSGAPSLAVRDLRLLHS